MPKPVCFPCQRFFRPEKNGFWFTEGMPVGPGRAAPGTAEPEKWKPYKMWQGDIWKCQGCGATIISGTAIEPAGVQHQDGFKELAEQLGANKYQVNDC